MIRHQRVVLWGLRDPTGDSFRHIWNHFSHALTALEKQHVWVPDEKAFQAVIQPGDLVFVVDVAAKNLGLPVDGVDYLLHNVSDTHPVRQGLDPQRCVYLQVWTNACADRGESWGPVRRWDKHARVLYQPWGTNLLPWEFREPVYNPDSKVVSFVGSVWDGNGQGNHVEIAKLRRALAKRGLTFDHRAGVSDEHNEELMRRARFAPAVAGAWQVEHEYLPCRVFKNISYGTLGVTNVPRFQDLFGDAAVWSTDLQALVDFVLLLDEGEWMELVVAQQEVVKDYTYATSLEMIGRAFDS